VLRRIFGPKRDEVIGGWRKLRNEKLYNFYSLPSIIRMIRSRRMRWAEHAARMRRRKKKKKRRRRNEYRILVGNPEGRRRLRRPGRRWEDNIRLDLRERGWGGVDWIDQAQDRDQWMALVNTVMSLRVP
jgi:hypothetical protein